MTEQNALLPAEALEQISMYFKALSEPNRLKILNLLCQGEANVGDIAEQLQLSPANISRHLNQLLQQGLLSRKTQGNHVYYCIADDNVYSLCNIVCENISKRLSKQSSIKMSF